MVLSSDRPILIMAMYADYPLSGRVNSTGFIPVLYDQNALNNAIRMWVCSFRNERLYRPGRGGFVVGALLKPMSEERTQEIRTEIETGLREDFNPRIDVDVCTVEADYENSQYYIHIEGSCPTFKESVTADVTVNSLGN